MAEQRKAVIKNADMSEDMQQDAVDIASQALSKYNIEKVSALPLIVSPCDEACLCRRLLFWQGIIGLVHRRSIQEQSVLFHGHYLSILCRRCCVVHRQSNELIFYCGEQHFFDGPPRDF